MSKAIVNALTLAVMEQYALNGQALHMNQAREFAEAFVAENAELFTTSLAQRMDPRAAPARPTAIPKCPNCHEPINDHMPNCARATGVDPRAVTAVHHLRVDGPPPEDS